MLPAIPKQWPPISRTESIANQTESTPTEQLRADIGYLASEELRGRGVGDESIDQAARYIARRMSEIGLETDAIAGSPLQPFDVVLGARPAGCRRNRLTVLAGWRTIGRDFDLAR